MHLCNSCVLRKFQVSEIINFKTQIRKVVRHFKRIQILKKNKETLCHLWFFGTGIAGMVWVKIKGRFADLSWPFGLVLERDTIVHYYLSKTARTSDPPDGKGGKKEENEEEIRRKTPWRWLGFPPPETQLLCTFIISQSNNTNYSRAIDNLLIIVRQQDYNIFFSLGRLDCSIEWTIEWRKLLTPFDANVEKGTLSF